jgi:hypothetical protein
MVTSATILMTSRICPIRLDCTTIQSGLVSLRICYMRSEDLMQHIWKCNCWVIIFNVEDATQTLEPWAGRVWYAFIPVLSADGAYESFLGSTLQLAKVDLARAVSKIQRAFCPGFRLFVHARHKGGECEAPRSHSQQERYLGFFALFVQPRIAVLGVQQRRTYRKLPRSKYERSSTRCVSSSRVL